jgi:NadR type nicotinamide-nucleotide adenylyltransferase
MLKKIALIGPESTGKSELSEKLAKHFNTEWVPEYARTYVATLTRPYNISDIVLIAKEQLKIEFEKEKIANQYLFIDTELIIAKVWAEDVYNTCPDFILKQLDKQRYDLYLLTHPDLPWIDDGIRENPHRRDYFFNIYKNELIKRNFHFVEISGYGEIRLRNAINAICKYFNF